MLQQNHVLWDVHCSGWSSGWSPRASPWTCIGHKHLKHWQKHHESWRFRGSLQRLGEGRNGQVKLGQQQLVEEMNREKSAVALWAERHQFARQKSTSGKGEKGASRGAEWDWKAFVIFHQVFQQFSTPMWLILLLVWAGLCVVNVNETSRLLTSVSNAKVNVWFMTSEYSGLCLCNWCCITESGMRILILPVLTTVAS